MAEKKPKLVEIKTKPTAASVEDFINSVENETRRKDAFALLKIMEKASGEKATMWGGTIVGFGSKRYKSQKTGREVDWLTVGFSPRKANLAVYLAAGIEQHAAALKKLGKHKTGVGCLYINKLEDVNIEVLEKMITESLKAESHR